MEIEIAGKTYKLKASMEFLEAVEPMHKTHVEGVGDQEIGLAMMISEARDSGDPRALRDLIYYLNIGQKPRMTKETVSILIEDENTDLEKLEKDVFDFLYEANVSRMRLKALDMLPKEETKKDLKA